MQVCYLLKPLARSMIMPTTKSTIEGTNGFGVHLGDAKIEIRTSGIWTLIAGFFRQLRSVIHGSAVVIERRTATKK